MLILDEAAVARNLSPAETLGLMRDALVACARGGAYGPLRSVTAMPAGWFATMPATIQSEGQRALGAKLVSAFPGNAERGLPTHQATIAMFDPHTGRMIALVAGAHITELRTAAVSVIATQALAHEPRGVHAILGAGVQGHSHLEAFAQARLITELRVWSRTPHHGLALVRRAVELGIAASFCNRPDEAVQDAAVITTTSGSPEPLFDARAVAESAHVNAVGACVPSRRELPGRLIARATIVVDSREAALVESGDLLLAARDGLFTPSRIAAELGDILANNTAFERRAGPTVFISLGLGIEDVACAAFVLGKVSLEKS